jgi:hypothetical protein
MKKIALALTALAAALLVAGCTTGLIYTHTRQPLTRDMHNTVIVPNSAAGDIKHIQISYVGVAWDSAAIGDVAKQHGLREVSYADLETLSVLGIWHQYTVHVYGM